MSIFLDMDPNLPNGYYVKTINKDIRDFISSLGVRELITIHWNIHNNY